MSRFYLTLLVALLATVTFAYWPGLQGGFVFDDIPNLVDNVAVHVTTLATTDWVAAILSSPSSSLQRPLAMFSFAINHYLTGLDPVPMKMTNVVIHLINTILVFGLVRSLIRLLAPKPGTEIQTADTAALLAAACWSLHPINLMAVLYVVQRMESFSHTFVFAGLWLYLEGRSHQIAGRPGWRCILGGLLPCAALGALVKESAILLPLYAFAIEFCALHFQASDRQSSRALKVIFVLLLAVPAVIGSLWLLSRSLSPGAFSFRDFTLSERLLTEPRVVFDYLRWIVFPDLGQLSLYHDDYLISRGLWNPPATSLAIIGLAVLLLFAWLFRARRPLLSLGILWFLGAQLLTATFLPLELVFEHRNYFASLGICLLLIDLLVLAPRTPAMRRSGILFALAFALVCAGLTHLRAREWRNPVSFAIAEAAKNPRSPRATYYLGWMLSKGSAYRADSPLIGPAFQAFDRARRLPNSNILPDQAALVLAARTGLPLQASWWQHMQRRLRERPIGAQETGALGGLVICTIEQLCSFNPDDMLATFSAALSQGPHAEVLSIYGNYVLNVLGDPDLALRLWQEANSLNPTEPQYHIGVIKLLIEMERFEDAKYQITKLRQMGRLGQYENIASGLERRLQGAARNAKTNPD